MTDSDPVLTNALAGASVTREIVIAPGALADLADVYRRLFGERPPLIVADDNTFAAAGKSAVARLRGAELAPAEPLVLPGTPRLKPRVEYAERIRAALAAADIVPVAVGSGVVNDLTKRAAALAERSYMCVATAASMDGYTASGAPLLDSGFKRTLPCSPPVAVVADLDVIGVAPPAMAGWGYGDLAGKVTAGLDWILADAIDEEAIDFVPFDTVQTNLAGWLADPEKIAAGDHDALARLVTGLAVSGLAIQAHGGSRPASGSEHQFSHLWEMEGLTVGSVPVAHGACVGVGTVAMLAAYRWLIDRDVSADAVETAVDTRSTLPALRRRVEHSFADANIRESAWTEAEAKYVSARRFHERLETLRRKWPEIRETLQEKLVPAATMQAWLRAAGAVPHFSELRLSAEQFATDHARAQLIRRRYTLLDTLTDLGWRDRAVGDLFGPGGFWSS